MSPPSSYPAGGHVVNTNCSAVHTRQALCCKMSVEYDKFMESGRKCVGAGPPGGQLGCRRAAHRHFSLPPGGSATWTTTTT